jgi:hypothetical protein
MAVKARASAAALTAIPSASLQPDGRTCADAIAELIKVKRKK